MQLRHLQAHRAFPLIARRLLHEIAKDTSRLDRLTHLQQGRGQVQLDLFVFAVPLGTAHELPVSLDCLSKLACPAMLFGLFVKLSR